jgi:hypothetical protein
MDEDLCSGWGKRSAIEVERTVDLGLGGQLWIHPGLSQKIESEETLREEFVPKIQREVGVGGTYSCNEVVLECVNVALGDVATMDVGGGATIGNQCQRCRETLATLLWLHC